MTNIQNNITSLNKDIPNNVCLVAVSKTKPESDLLEAYQSGQRIFGENKVQEMVEKYENLPKDIKWHFIGHLQTNKVKFIVPFVELIHAVDSIKLLNKINNEAIKCNKVVNVLLQVHIANEETKFGFGYSEIKELLESNYKEQYTNIEIKGLMAMATNTNDEYIVKSEFTELNNFFNNYKSNDFDTLSMGMSNDYKLAIECGSNMVRTGSTIFGARNYNI
jgi:pyridoxal phosphate enzyme (YggS family)